MAKRTIQECDLTKQEYDPDTTVSITIKAKGKSRGRSYDLSPEAASKLERQLVSGDPLPEGWDFTASVKDESRSSSRGRSSQTLGDLDDDPDAVLESDAQFVAEKKASLREHGVLGDDDSEEEEPREPSGDSPVGRALGATGDKCRHMNKGRIQTTMRGGKRFIYRKCTECRKDIPEQTSDAKEQYMSGRAPKGVRIRDL